MQTIRKTCRSCKSQKLKKVLSLGNLFISDFLKINEKGENAPLDLVICQNCSLVQLKHNAVDPEKLYRNYWYKSGMNSTMVNALKDIAIKAEKYVKLKKDDLVVDIGANDGTLLRQYTSPNIIKVGFEPALNLIPEAEVGTDKIINNFFNYKDFQKLFLDKKAKIITSIAMFYDLEEPNIFVSDVVNTLASDGIWIIQMAYLPSMLELNAFDNICHEHIEYYSLLSLENLLKSHQLIVRDVELNDVNGGSFRIYITHKNNKNIRLSKKSQKTIDILRRDESKNLLHTMKPYRSFENRVLNLRKICYQFIRREKRKGKKISVYGASTKGNTLLQYYNLNNELIDSASERNPNKWGLKTVGTRIPIKSEIEIRREKPDYLLVLPWHFLNEFIEREREYFKGGGHFIIPLPEFKII